MQLTQTVSEGLKRSFRVVIPASDLEARLKEKIEEVRPKLKINGFRPGKVPEAHVRKLYGPSMFREIIDGEVDAAAKQALAGETRLVAAGPSLRLDSDLDKVMAGQADLAFDLDVELIPEIDPVDLSGIELERLVAPVQDAQVDEMLADLAKSNREYEAKDGAAEDGDAVVVDFVGKLDGEIFEGGSADGATIVIGSGQLIPGFEDGLKGVSTGDKRTLELSFPEDYPRADLAGRPVTFDISAHEVKAPKDPALDDEFAAKIGFGDLDSLKKAVRERIEAEHAGQSRLRAKRTLFDKLDAMLDFPLPPGMVEQEFQQIWAQVEQAKARGEVDPDDAGKSDEELKGEYRKIANRRVKLGLALADIGRRAGVEISNDELAGAIGRQARQYPGQERQVIEAYRSNPQLLAQLRAPLYEEKAVDHILENVKSTETVVDRETLFADPEE